MVTLSFLKIAIKIIKKTLINVTTWSSYDNI